MTRFVALLHAVNLGKTRKVPMAQLRDLLGQLGLEDVQTYIQSGNAVFSASQPPESLRPLLEQALEAEFGFAVPVTLRSADEWAALIAACPPELLTEPVYVGLLRAEPEAQALATLRQRPVAPERWAVAGRTLYQTVPAGVKNLKLSHAVIERVLGVSCTVRNWNSVQKIGELVSAYGASRRLRRV